MVLAGPPRKHQDRVTASLAYGHGSGARRARPSVLWHGEQRGAFLLVPFMRLRCSPWRRAGPDIPSASAAPGLIIAFYAADRLRRSRKKKRQLRRSARETPGWRRRNPTWTSGGQRFFSAALETLRVDH
ncbi:hypothetical protein MTO96_043887 [Rhipicephalus appendiculatus]